MGQVERLELLRRAADVSAVQQATAELVASDSGATGPPRGSVLAVVICVVLVTIEVPPRQPSRM